MIRLIKYYMKNRKIFIGLIVFTLAFSLVTVASAQTLTIPSWIKNIAGFWAEDKISDQDFIAAIQYLFDHGMLKISTESSKPPAPIPETEELEAPEGFSDLELLTFKVTQLQELVSNPKIIQAVIDSNAKFEAMDDPYQYIIEKDEEWRKQSKNKDSAFMGTLIENPTSRILKTKSVISTEEFGDVLFPEIIVTNAYGANVAITIRTDDYNQGKEVWWIKAKKIDVQFRDLMWDESAKIYSSDIIIVIVDEAGHFIGVLNAATPVK